MTASRTLRAEAAKRILIKDGAYGTSIQDRKLKSGDYCGPLDLLKDQRGNNDLLNLTKPEVVRSICESFADAGAEILATNTFNANAISQADYGFGALQQGQGYVQFCLFGGDNLYAASQRFVEVSY